jgi:hypothetical protein
MIRRLLPFVLPLAVAACAAPSSKQMYPTAGTALAPSTALLEWEAAPEPVELPDPAATRDAPRGPPPLPTEPLPQQRRAPGLGNETGRFDDPLGPLPGTTVRRGF